MPVRQISIIHDVRQFASISVHPADVVFLDLSHNSSTNSYFLTKGIQPAQKPLIDDSLQKEFIKNFNSLMDQMGQANEGSYLWWATDMASKNQFSSGLPRLLEEWFLIHKTIGQCSVNCMIIVGVDYALVKALQQSFKTKGMDCKVKGYGFSIWIRDFIFSLRKMGGIIMHAYRVWKKSCLSRSILFPQIKENFRESGEYVLRSFIYNSSFTADGYRDSFFGQLPEYLKKNHRLIVLAQILGDYRFCLKAIKNCKGWTILPYEMFLTLFDVLSALCIALIWKIKVPLLKFEDRDVTSIVQHVLWRSYQGVQFSQWIQYWSVRRFLNGVKPKKFLLTYENYPWERMTVMALRENSPETVIHGYQHTVVPQSYTNYFVSSYEKMIKVLPDKIYVVGEEAKNIMDFYGDYSGIPLEASCGLRFEYLSGKETKAIRRQAVEHILVPLEGFFYVHPMVSYVIRQLATQTQYKVRIRTHPLLPWPKLQERFGFSIKDVAHFSVSSSKSLQEDLNWADVVIYWSSTVSLEALMMGKPVIHFNDYRILSYDPLFRCNDFKKNALVSQSIVDILNEFNALDQETWEKQQQEAKNYIRSYFNPVTQESLKKFI